MTFAAVLTGCGSEAVLEESSLVRVADEYVATYNDFDETRLTAIFASPPSAEWFRDHFTWTQDRIGKCGAPRAMWRLGDKQAGFSYLCERGEMYQYFTLDDHGRLLRTNGGAAGRPAEGALATALDTVLAAMPGDAATLAAQPWARPLLRDWVVARGRCELERTVVVGERSGAFELSCERKSLTMKLRVGNNGQIESVQLWREPQDYSGVFFKAPVG